jgi:putative acetyltransferase
MINAASAKDHSAILELWELSVRATHTFLPEDYLQKIKTLLPSILSTASLLFVHINDEDKTIDGFLGVEENKIEMLFIHPQKRGRGIGKVFIEFAIEKLSARKVDVNEQNEQAVIFYKKVGFTVVGRTELDGLGKPFPLLQMELIK